jgi:hypothetical protein
MGEKIVRTPAMKEATGQELESRIRSYLLDGGLQCSQCVLALLRDRLGPDSARLEAAAQPFGRGIAGTGNVCGALTGALLALGALYGSGGPEPRPSRVAPIGYLSAQPPTNDLLDAVPAVGIEPPVFSASRELKARLAESAPEGGETLDCHDLSNVDWTAPTRDELSRYYAGDGAATCVRLIGVAVESVRALAPEAPGTTS